MDSNIDFYEWILNGKKNYIQFFRGINKKPEIIPAGLFEIYD